MKPALRVIQLVLPAGILWLLYRSVPFEEVWRALRAAAWLSVAVAAVVMLGMQLVHAYRFRLLTNHQGFSLGALRLMGVNLATLFYKLFVPGGLLAGMGLRFYNLVRAERRMVPALSSILVDRLAGAWGLSVSGVLCWTLDRQAPGGQFGWIMGLAMVAGVIAYALLVVGAGTRLGQRAVGAIPIPVLSGQLRSWLDSLALFRSLSRRDLVVLVALSLLPHLVGIAAYGCVAAALGLELSLLTLGWIRCLVGFLTTLPIAVAGIGVRDGALLYLLGLYGVPADQALAFSFLVFGIAVLLPALLGGALEAVALIRRPTSDRANATLPPVGPQPGRLLSRPCE